MRILFLAINYWPEATGIAPFTTGRCEYLAERGHSVTIVTSFPYYPQWKIWNGWRGRIRFVQMHDGVRIERLRIYVPARATPLRRIFHEGSFVAASLANSFGAQRPDLIVTVSPPLGLAVAAIALSRRWQVPYLFHVTDLQPDAAVELGMLRRRAITSSLYALERMAYRNAAKVSTLTEAMRRRLLAKGIPADKLMLSPDWADGALFKIAPTGGDKRFRTQYGLEGRTLVVHAGNMGVKQGLEVMVRAAALARTRAPQLAFLLVGDGAARSQLERESKALGLDNLRFLPLLRLDEFHDLLAASDISVISQQRCVADNVFPSKTLTLLAAARPVVGSLSPGSEVARVLLESGAGLRCEPEQPDALLDAIVTLASDPARRRTMGFAGRSWAIQHWNQSTILRRFEADLLRVTSPERLYAVRRSA